MEKILQFNDQNFNERVLNSELPVLVDFWAEWCGPCHMLAPIVKELANDFDGRLKVGKIDVDESPSIAAQFGIRSIPTLILYKHGQELVHLTGVHPKNEIVQTINYYLGQEVMA
ncbi:MAG: thioredoxin [bacterium]